MEEKNKLGKIIKEILRTINFVCVIGWLISFIIMYVYGGILGGMVNHLVTYFFLIRGYLKDDLSQERYISEKIMVILMIVAGIILTIHSLFVSTLLTIAWIFLWNFILWFERP